MKYFNKTRTIEQKVTDREVLSLLQKQVVLLEEILNKLHKKDDFFISLKQNIKHAKTFWLVHKARQNKIVHA